MIGIAILAIAATALFWRLDRMVERSRFDSDVNRFRSTLLSTRSLAINTKMDFRLELKKLKEGWRGWLNCREDCDVAYPIPRFSDISISFDQQSIEMLSIDFYSSGFVGPEGLLTLSHGSQRREFKLPEFFYRQEGALLPPTYPSSD